MWESGREEYPLSPAAPRQSTVSRYATGYTAGGYDDDDNEGESGYEVPSASSAFTGDLLRLPGKAGAAEAHFGDADLDVSYRSDLTSTRGASAWGNFGTSGTTPGHGSTLGRGAIGGWEGDESLYEGSAGADPLNASGLGESYVNYDDDVDYDDGTHAPFVTTVQRRLLEQFSTVLSETFTSPFDDADALTDLLVAHIEALRRKAPLLPKARQTEVLAEIMQLKKERNTWSLLATVLRDRENPIEIDDVVTGPKTDTMVLEALQCQDATLRRCAYVVQWLEYCSGYDYQIIDAKNYESVDVRWGRTLDFLNSMENKPAEPSTKVKTLDPDATVREGKTLQGHDHVDEDKLLQKLINLVRIGDLPRAQELCTTSGQPWRAVSLGGGTAWHDPQLGTVEADGDPDSGGGSTAQSGNWNRDLWKLNALHLSQDSSCSDRERALYASLCGNLPVLREFFRSWEDLLWAHFSVLVDRRREEELRVEHGHHDSLAQLPEWYYETSHDEMSVLTPQQIFASVNGREPPSEPFHRIQQWVVMYCVDPDNGSAHLDELVQYLRDTVETNTLVLPHSSVNQPTAQPPLEQGRLRFFAHLVIFLRGVGLLPRRLKPVPRGAPLGPENERVAAGNLVIGKYVESLTESEYEPHYALIATYTAELDARAQVERYTAFLRRFVDTDKRRKYLEHAEAAGLDLPAITKELAGREWREHAALDDTELARGIERSQGGATTRDAPGHSTTLGDTFAGLSERPWLDESDKRKIQSLEWLTFNGSDRPEAIRQSNTAMRGFLAAGKVEAAKQVLGMLPYDTDEIAESEIGKRRLTFELEEELKEFRAMRAFLEANDAFIAWDRRRSTPPVALTLGDVDPRGFVQRQQDEEDFARREARWEDETSAAAQNAIAQMDAALGHVVRWCSTIEGLHLDFTFESELGASVGEADIVAACEEAVMARVNATVVWSGLYPELEQGVAIGVTWRVQLQPTDSTLVDDDRRIAELVKDVGRDRPLQITVDGSQWTAQSASLGRFGVVKVIRKLCVPALVESMHEVYYANDEHIECVRLAELVSTNSTLFEAYRGNQDRLTTLLGRLRASALKVLENQSLDAFGCPRMN